MLRILVRFCRWRLVLRPEVPEQSNAEGALILAHRVIAEQKKIIERQKQMIEELSKNGDPYVCHVGEWPAGDPRMERPKDHRHRANTIRRMNIIKVSWPKKLADAG
jgi:hypothetical protein